jgi:glucose-6-phosphate isomerase
MIMVDLSRQRMTLETLNHLLRLATSRNVKKFITQLSWGPNNPDNPIIPKRLQNHHQQQQQQPHADDGVGRSKRHDNNSQQGPVCNIRSYHLSLRVPSNQGLEMLDTDGSNVLVGIHNDWDRIKRLSDSLRLGKLSGVTGSMIKDVVVVGRNIPIMALRFVYLALCKDEAATIGRRVGMDSRSQKGPSQRRIKFLTSVDPVRAAAVVADSDPASTLVVSIALAGEEGGTSMATKNAQNWLLTNLGGHGRRTEQILSKHMMLITGHEELAAQHKPESVFLIPRHSRCEPFTTFTAASLLPLSIVFGWPIVDEFLAGAHDMDSHFVETNPRHNLPILLGLTDIWNDCLDRNSNTASRIVTPFTEAFAAYPAFVAAMESQTCGRKHSVVIDGGLHGVYDRSLYQSSNILPSELVMTLDSQLATNTGGAAEEVYRAQDSLICSLFAHADGLAFGSTDYLTSPYSPGGSSHTSSLNESTPSNHISADEGNLSSGNRPSTVLLCGKLDSFTCGQLVALAEHRAVIKAWILEIDPFPREVGTVHRSKRTESLKNRLEKMMFRQNEGEEDDEDDKAGGDSELNLSTKTILQHYANMYRNERIYTVKS